MVWNSCGCCEATLARRCVMWGGMGRGVICYRSCPDRHGIAANVVLVCDARGRGVVYLESLSLSVKLALWNRSDLFALLCGCVV